jgi:hypothetical protein
LYLAAVLVVAACGPKAGKTTKVVGQFGEEAPETVRILVGESTDTTVTVTDGRFELEIPTDILELAYVQTDMESVPFIPDGSTITVDPVACTAVSSNKKGVQSRFVAYDEWMSDFLTDYRSKIAGFGDDEEAAEEYFEQIIGDYNAYQRGVIEANRDNILGLMAFMQLMEDDTEVMKDVLDGFTDEVKALPVVAEIRQALETRGMEFEEVEPGWEFEEVEPE